MARPVRANLLRFSLAVSGGFGRIFAARNRPLPCLLFVKFPPC